MLGAHEYFRAEDHDGARASAYCRHPRHDRVWCRFIDAGKFKRERRKMVGWTLILSGLASTISDSDALFGKKEPSPSEH